MHSNYNVYTISLCVYIYIYLAEKNGLRAVFFIPMYLINHQYNIQFPSSLGDPNLQRCELESQITWVYDLANQLISRLIYEKSSVLWW